MAATAASPTGVSSSSSSKRSLGTSSFHDDQPSGSATAMRLSPAGAAAGYSASSAGGGSKTRFAQLGGYRRSGMRWPQTISPTGSSTSTTTLSSSPAHPTAANTNAAPGEVLLSPKTWTQTLSKMGPPSSPRTTPRNPSRTSAASSGMQPRSAGNATVKRQHDDPFRTPSISSVASFDSPDAPSGDPMAVLQEQAPAGAARQAPLFGDDPSSPSGRALRHRSSTSSVASSSARHSISSCRPSSAVLSPVATDPLRSSTFPSPSNTPLVPSPTVPMQTADRPALRDPFVADLSRPLHIALPAPPSPTSPYRVSPLPSSSSTSPWSLDASEPSPVVESRRPSAPQLLRPADEDPSTFPTTTTERRQLGVRRVSQPLLPLGLGYRFGTAATEGERFPRGPRDLAQREEMVAMWKAWAVESKRELETGRRSRADENLMDSSILAHAFSSRSSVDSVMTSSVGTSRGRAGSRTSSSRFPLLGASHVHDSFVSLPPLAVVPLRPLPMALPPPFPLGGGGAVGTGARPYNPFVPLRRRFALRPASNRPNVAVELLGELVEVLADYIALYGRKVKVATAAMPPAPPVPAPVPLFPHHHPQPDEGSDVAPTDELVEPVCEELDALVAELVDVLPAFGTALTVGGYGPLALSRVGDRRSPGERFSAWAPREPLSTAEDGTTTTMGGRWWAERLLRDLIEGLIGDDERSWAHYRSVGDGGQLTREEEVLTGALAALVEEDEVGSAEPGEGSNGGSQREKELLESGMRRWNAWKRSARQDL